MASHGYIGVLEAPRGYIGVLEASLSCIGDLEASLGCIGVGEVWLGCIGFLEASPGNIGVLEASRRYHSRSRNGDLEASHGHIGVLGAKSTVEEQFRYSSGSTTGIGIRVGSAARIFLWCANIKRGAVTLAIPILATVSFLLALRLASAGHRFQHSQGEVCSFGK